MRVDRLKRGMEMERDSKIGEIWRKNKNES
jgi:hypothetical protein